MLLGFLPFVVFAAGDHFATTFLALVLAALTAAALAARDVAAGRRFKLLEAGAALLFGALAIYTGVAHASWTVVGVRLWTDGGLFVLVLLSILIGQPFTLQYAKERVPERVWANPAFFRKNMRISSVWAGAFAFIILADAAMLAGLPVAIGAFVSLGAFGAAAFYTKKNAHA